MSSPSPEYLLDRPLLRRLAGEQSFARGEECFSTGRVRQLNAAADRVSAQVNGERTYRVKLWRRRGELRFRCDCDDGRTDAFCQHCVAVGLAWLSQPGDRAAAATPGGVDAGKTPAPGKRDEARRAAERRQLEEHVRTFDPQRLAELLLEATDYDEILRRRLLLEAIGIATPPAGRHARQSVDLRATVAVYRQLLKEAVQPAGYVDFQAMADYVQGIEEAIAPLSAWLRRGWHHEVIELVEVALVELDAASDRVDIGDPLLNRIYDDLQKLHLAACRGPGINVVELAGRLLHYELEGGLGIFNQALQNYGEILGAEGRQAWRTSLIREWTQMTAKRADKGLEQTPRRSIDHRRFQVQNLMERLANAEGNLEALLALKRTDLRSAQDHVALAEWLESEGRPLDALRTAEHAAATFTSPHEQRLTREFLLAAYRRTNDLAAALPLQWQQFEEAPDLERFRELKSLVQGIEPAQWPEWRERAFALLRTRSDKGRVRAGDMLSTTRSDHSRLVEALLEEGLEDEAWHVARVDGCREDLWRLLADRRAAAHPGDALEVYQRQCEQAIVAGGGDHSYREACELLGRIRAVFSQAGRASEFGPYVASLRMRHRKKRAFQRQLAAFEP